MEIRFVIPIIVVLICAFVIFYILSGYKKYRYGARLLPPPPRPMVKKHCAGCGKIIDGLVHFDEIVYHKECAPVEFPDKCAKSSCAKNITITKPEKITGRCRKCGDYLEWVGLGEVPRYHESCKPYDGFKNQ